MNLSSFTRKALAVSLILASTTGLALAKGSYKGENLKGEAMPVCPPPKLLLDGWYLGAQVGYDSYRVRESIGDDIGSANPVIAANGWVGGLFLGYGQYLTDLFYLGGEIFGNVSGANQAWVRGAAGANSYYKFEANGSYGLALLPGIRLNDGTLGYVRLGWNWANLKGNGSVTAGGDSDSNNKSNTSNGFNFGLGLETLVYENWSVRTEYSHTWYSNFTNSTTNTSFNPSDNQFMLGVLYHFA